MKIRDFTLVDLPYLYDICVRTGDCGGDGRSLFSDSCLPGQYYAAPYAACDQRCVLVLEGEVPGGTRPLGYILGTPDTRAYQSWFDSHWRLAAASLYCATADACLHRTVQDRTGTVDMKNIPYSAEEARIRSLFIHPFDDLPPLLLDYPGHIHIDILPAGQGAGWGRLLMDAFCERLKSLGCPGFHLGVDKRNSGGIAFYHRYGMKVLQEPEWGIVFGQRL